MTTTKAQTLRDWLNLANLNNLPDALRAVQLGNVLAPIKITVTGLTAAAAIDITTAAVKAAATVAGISLASDENLPAIGVVRTLRCSASGTANSVGSYAVTDEGGTAVSPTAGANVGLALMSDDGKTLTFPTTVTGFVLEYYPRTATALTAATPVVTP